jgi:hypothetical protein
MAIEVISHLETCSREGTSLQRGMNFGLGGDHSMVLIPVRPNAPYRDRLKDERSSSSVQNTITSEVLFRALFTQDGAQRLEVARA